MPENKIKKDYILVPLKKITVEKEYNCNEILLYDDLIMLYGKITLFDHLQSTFSIPTEILFKIKSTFMLLIYCRYLKSFSDLPESYAWTYR